MKLVQKHRGERRTFLIQANGLKISEDSSFGTSRRTIPFENITNEFVSLKFNPIHYLVIIVLGVLVIFSFLVLKMYNIDDLGKIYRWILIFLVGGIFGIYNFKMASTVLRCIDFEGIEFYKNEPSKKEMDLFIKELFKRRNLYLEERFEKVNPNLNYEYQYGMFYHLHSLEIIDSEKLDKLISELDKAFEGEFITFSKN
ncbi:hypothetical protein [Ulvibacterium marinum]|uniref:Uncharacterized protein n=1 Tax=Ulvibacterium marinum TaxID=2419782 RepID=A0A3B0C154_9FLAO|nr:hypothetical protein [Ulvibacterium marinum]RKN78471.1 hypothetical protein D7Z94_19855 [Ulvibacterium marinum]